MLDSATLALLFVNNQVLQSNPSRSLRSSKANLLNEPRFNVNNYGGRAFYVYSPRLWNKLPTTIRACVDFMEFKSKLKTHFV